VGEVVQPEQEVPKHLIFEGKEANSDVDKVILPLLPLRGMLVFPYMVTSLEVGRDKSLSALDKAMDGERLILLAAQRQAKINEPDPKDIYETGTMAEVKQLLKMADGTVRVLVEGICRAKII
jgi:ATP-dependent Lon protease